ncbi:MAG: nuclear transport factor 2 family protein [Pyrinomonadaceae bacterium]|nr:nuclear transport factor 2 family protein [Pyrinomonadaceae bacterium]
MKIQQPFGAKRVLKLWLVVLVTAVVVLAAPEPTPVDSGIEQEKRVREFVGAFNTRNVDAMLEVADENVQWLSVDGAKVSVETEGKAALRESMERYFRSCPSCKSSLEWIQSAGSRVTALERASWSGKSGAKSQRGLSVYEFRGGKILRVYYFPAEVDSQPPVSK